MHRGPAARCSTHMGSAVSHTRVPKYEFFRPSASPALPRLLHPWMKTFLDENIARTGNPPRVTVTSDRLHKTGFRSKSNTCNSQRFTNLVFISTSQVAGMRCPTTNHFFPTQNVVRPLRYISNLIDLFGRGRKTEFCTIGE